MLAVSTTHLGFGTQGDAPNRRSPICNSQGNYLALANAGARGGTESPNIGRRRDRRVGSQQVGKGGERQGGTRMMYL